VDSDLAESVAALKDIFSRRGIAAAFGKADPAVVEDLRKTLRVPARFRAFLQAADPVDVETVTPVERVRLFPAQRLPGEQNVEGTNGKPAAWRKTWIIVGRSALLGDPYFLDVSKLDAEGDCPVYSCMMGTDSLKPELCASSFQQFLRILATAMEVATASARPSSTTTTRPSSARRSARRSRRSTRRRCAPGTGPERLRGGGR
jgi:hypothetical protein